MLTIGKGVTLPLDAATETFGILAKRGAGKSNAAVVMAEEMWAAGIPWVAIDPKGDWWGVRSSADGKRPGLALPVFGGEHGDLPLEPRAGALVADLIVDNRLTSVLDVSEFSKADARRFLIDFAERLLKRNRRCFLWTTNRHLRHAWSVLEAWGYEPQNRVLVWCKPPRATKRVTTEFVLIGKRGKPEPMPWHGTTWFQWPVTMGHSHKPDAFLDLVETWCPGPYVELFSRSPRFGWDSWGKGYETELRTL